MFKNRTDACLQLFEENKEELELLNPLETVILGLGKGGLEIAEALAVKLKCMFDVIFVEKLYSNNNQDKIEIGAVGQTDGSVYLNKELIKKLEIKESFIDNKIELKRRMIKEKEDNFRNGKDEIILKEKNVIICSDGVITGTEMLAAAREVWNRQPKKVITYVPVFSLEGFERIEKEVDSVIKLIIDKELFGASQYYEEF